MIKQQRVGMFQGRSGRWHNIYNPKDRNQRASRVALMKIVKEYVETITPKLERQLEEYRSATGYKIEKYTMYDIKSNAINEIYNRLTAKGQSPLRNWDVVKKWIEKTNTDTDFNIREIQRIGGKENLHNIFVGDNDDVHTWDDNIYVQGRLQTAGGGAFIIVNALQPYKEFYYTTEGNELIHDHNDNVRMFGKDSAEARKSGKLLADKEKAFDEQQRLRSEAETLALAKQKWDFA